MSYLRIVSRPGTEAQSAKQAEHRCVVRQDVRYQLLQSSVSREFNQMPQKCRADAFALIGIDHDEGQFGDACFRYDVAAATNDHGTTAFLRFCDQSDVVAKIDVDEERDLSFGEAALWNKEATLQGLSAGSPDRREHVVA